MRLKKYILLIFALMLLTSFSDASREDYLLRKIWVYQSYYNSVLVYKRKNSFSKEAVGYQFLENGKMKIRQNSSWAGEDPKTYELVKGDWEMSRDSIITLKFKYLHEDRIEKRKIVELTLERLILRIVK